MANKTYRDLLNQKMGPVNPEKTYSLTDAAKDASKGAGADMAKSVTGPVIFKSGQTASQGGTTTVKGGSRWSTPGYTSKYQSALDGAISALRGMGDFSYDPESDPLYQSYKDQYTRLGKQSMQDTLGQVSARTGGLASSYATSAAQQANNNYMAQLADKIPQLQQLAYQMYRDQRGDLQDDVSMYSQLENQDRSRYESDRSFDYGAFRDAISDQRYEDETEYNRGRDAISDQRYADETAYERGRDAVSDQRYADETAYDRGRDAISDARYEDETEYNRGRDAISDQRYEDETAYERGRDDLSDAWQLYELTGQTDKLAKALDLDDSTVQKLVSVFAQSQQTGSSGSGGSGRFSGDGILEQMLTAPNGTAAKQILLDSGLAQWKADEYWKMYLQQKLTAADTKGLFGQKAASSSGNDPKLDMVKTDIGQAIREGKSPQSILDSVWDSGQYSDAQLQELLDYLKDQGYAAG